MKKHIAALFPGQGSQKQNMADELVKRSSAARDVFSECSDILGTDVLKLTRLSEKEIEPPVMTHKIIPVTSLAAWAVFKEMNQADFVAGHSLGELTALAAAGVCSIEEMLNLCSLRGKLMQETTGTFQGGMSAVLNSSLGEISAVCEKTAGEGENRVWVANINSYNQVVIAGTKTKLDEAEKTLITMGAQCIRLKTACAFHTPHMGAAVAELMVGAEKIKWKQPEIPVVSARTGKPYLNHKGVPYELALQLMQPVKWLNTVLFLKNAHVKTVYEMTPAGTLTGLIKAIDKSLECHIV